MSEPATQPSVPIALASGQGEAFWFFGTLATIKASSETTSGRVAVTAHLAPEGAASPLHVHHNEDEWFYVTEGAATLGWRQDHSGVHRFVCIRTTRHPHTFMVTSPQARFLLVTERAGFEKFVRMLGPREVLQ